MILPTACLLLCSTFLSSDSTSSPCSAEKPPSVLPARAGLSLRVIGEERSINTPAHALQTRRLHAVSGLVREDCFVKHGNSSVLVKPGVISRIPHAREFPFNLLPPHTLQKLTAGGLAVPTIPTPPPPTRALQVQGHDGHRSESLLPHHALPRQHIHSCSPMSRFSQTKATALPATNFANHASLLPASFPPSQFQPAAHTGGAILWRNDRKSPSAASVQPLGWQQQNVTGQTIPDSALWQIEENIGFLPKASMVDLVFSAGKTARPHSPHAGISKSPAQTTCCQQCCCRHHACCETHRGKQPVVHDSTSTLIAAVEHAHGPALLAFTANWCAPCRKMQPVLNELRSAGVVVHRVDIDENPDLAEKFKVNSIPTLVLVGHQQPKLRLRGYQPAASIKEWLGKAAVVPRQKLTPAASAVKAMPCPTKAPPYAAIFPSAKPAPSSSPEHFPGAIRVTHEVRAAYQVSPQQAAQLKTLLSQHDEIEMSFQDGEVSVTAAVEKQHAIAVLIQSLKVLIPTKTTDATKGSAQKNQRHPQLQKPKPSKLQGQPQTTRLQQSMPTQTAQFKIHADKNTITKIHCRPDALQLKFDRHGKESTIQVMHTKSGIVLKSSSTDPKETESVAKSRTVEAQMILGTLKLNLAAADQGIRLQVYGPANLLRQNPHAQVLQITCDGDSVGTALYAGEPSNDKQPAETLRSKRLQIELTSEGLKKIDSDQ